MKRGAHRIESGLRVDVKGAFLGTRTGRGWRPGRLRHWGHGQKTVCCLL